MIDKCELKKAKIQSMIITRLIESMENSKDNINADKNIRCIKANLEEIYNVFKGELL